jgi:hypothetical protein
MNAGHPNIAARGSEPSSKQLSNLQVGLQCLFVVCLGLVTACETGPVAETKQFEQATTAVNSAGQPLLDDMALAERTRGQNLAVSAARTRTSATTAEDVCRPPWRAESATTPKVGIIDGFCPGDARYYSKIGDPPDTRVFRTTLTFLMEFAHALSELADGTSAATATAQLQTLVDNAAGLAGGPGAQAAGVKAATEAFMAIAQPLVKQLAQAASVAQERQVIADAAPKIRALIGQMRTASGPMFATIIEQDMLRYGAPGVSSEENAQIATRVGNYRKILSDYVALLENLEDAWGQLATAAQSRTNAASLASLATHSAQIEAGAIAIRQSLAQLRLGQPQK